MLAADATVTVVSSAEQQRRVDRVRPGGDVDRGAVAGGVVKARAA